jgi:hypothetical protein
MQNAMTPAMIMAAAYPVGDARTRRWTDGGLDYAACRLLRS